MRRPQHQALRRDARDQDREDHAEQKLITRNNVGVEDSENIFRINDLLPLVRSEGARICCDFNGLPMSFNE